MMLEKIGISNLERTEKTYQYSTHIKKQAAN